MFIVASKPLKPFQGLKHSGYAINRLLQFVRASKPLKPFQGLKQTAIHKNNSPIFRFKASKTLSGIETTSPTLLLCSQIASKPLKPFQGLKR